MIQENTMKLTLTTIKRGFWTLMCFLRDLKNYFSIAIFDLVKISMIHRNISGNQEKRGIL